MIISQTPYRVSFAGGGTDLSSFYEQEDFGAVFSVTIRQHMYVTVHSRFDDNIRISYSETETANSLDEVKHELVREALRATSVRPPLEVTTIGDVPAGTGLGSSSTLTVGLLNAFRAYRGLVSSPDYLAREACAIEIDRLGHPIGKQDQYAAAYGGFNYIRFLPDGTVDVERIPLSDELRSQFEQHVLMLYTAQRRRAKDILQAQSEGTNDKRTELRAMRELAGAMTQALSAPDSFREFGRLLDEGWQLKRSLGFGISNSKIDEWYHAACRAGAWGGKLLGAGGGGFLLLFAPPEKHTDILARLGHPKQLEFRAETRGSRLVFISD